MISVAVVSGSQFWGFSRFYSCQLTLQDAHALETLGRFGALNGDCHFFLASWDVSNHGCFSQSCGARAFGCPDRAAGDRDSPLCPCPAGAWKLPLEIVSGSPTPRALLWGPHVSRTETSISGTWNTPGKSPLCAGSGLWRLWLQRFSFETPEPESAPRCI